MEEQEQQINIIKEALLVEDNAGNVKIFSYYLRELGYQVEIARDAKTGIKFIQNKPYTLIVTDLGLPDKPGEEVIKEVCQNELNQSTPLIVCTAHADQKKEQECIGLGADKVLIKGFDMEMFEKVIKNCFSEPGYERRFDRQLKTLIEETEKIISEVSKYKKIELCEKLNRSLKKLNRISSDYQFWKKNHLLRKALNSMQLEVDGE